MAPRQTEDSQSIWTEIMSSTEVGDVHFIGDLERLRRSKLPPLLPFYSGVFLIAVVPLIIMLARGRGVVLALWSAVSSGKHVHLSKVRNLHHNSVIVLGKRLLPRFSIDPHVCMVSCSSVKLKSNPMCLHKKTKNSRPEEIRIDGL